MAQEQAPPDHWALKITAAEFIKPRTVYGEVTDVRVKLEDGSERTLITYGRGRVHLEARSVVGRTFGSAYMQICCWIHAADRKIHRIIGIEKIGPVADVPGRPNTTGICEVVARMSDGNVTRIGAFFPDKASFEPEELLDLSFVQARLLMFEREQPGAVNSPDHSMVHACLLCGRNH